MLDASGLLFAKEVLAFMISVFLARVNLTVVQRRISNYTDKCLLLLFAGDIVTVDFALRI